MDKSHCAGCHDDVYNHGLGGAKECWLLKSAFLTHRKRVPLDQVPPWTQPASVLPSCYTETGFIFVGPGVTR